MTLGEKLKQRRKEKKIPADTMARELGVSLSTIYRYEDSSIEKIPVQIFEKMCTILGTTTAEIMNPGIKILPELPSEFTNAQDAMEFILKVPTLAAFGGYDPSTMSEETFLDFANEILQQLKLVSYKYKK